MTETLDPQPQPQPEPQPEPELEPELLPAGRNTLMLEMTDGINLSTDVYIPEGTGPWPVKLVRTPYNKEHEQVHGEEVMGEDTVLVTQDVRGRFESDGLNIPLIGEDLGEHQDGLDTYTWISKQPWCNGRIASVGGSALGMTQLYSAPRQPPGLVCQFIGVAPASMFHEFVYQGGAFRQEQMELWIEVNKFSPESLELYREHPTNDEFWEPFSMVASVGDVTAPGMHWGGWFDTFSQGTINTFLLRQHQGGAGAQGQQWMIMGPWTHADMGTTKCGEMVLPDIALKVPDNAYVAFMDYFLKGKANGFVERPAVTYYVLGAFDEEDAPGHEWRYADDWPPPASNVHYYLQADGGLRPSLPAGVAQSAWSFDPADPPPTLGGRNLLIERGIYDQVPIEQREDVVVFETNLLSEPLEVTGRVTCRFWVSCDAVDSDVAVRLCDVYPDGRSLMILDGIQRLRYRNSDEQTELLSPGVVYEVEVDLWSISMIFNAGHRVRLSVCGGNNPRWDVNPGTGEQWTDGGTHVVQNTVLHHSPATPSALILPIAQ